MSEDPKKNTAAEWDGKDPQDVVERLIKLTHHIAEQSEKISALRREWAHRVIAELKRLGGRNPGPHIGELESIQVHIERHDREFRDAAGEFFGLAKVAAAGASGLPLEAIGTIPVGDVVVQPVVKDRDGRTGAIVSVNNADGTAVVGYPDGTTAVHLQEEVKDTNGQPFNFSADPHE